MITRGLGSAARAAAASEANDRITAERDELKYLVAADQIAAFTAAMSQHLRALAAGVGRAESLRRRTSTEVGGVHPCTPTPAGRPR